jgi:hypothetical protein
MASMTGRPGFHSHVVVMQSVIAFAGLAAVVLALSVVAEALICRT